MMSEKRTNQERPILNKEINIAEGSSRFTQVWKNKTITISEFISRLKKPTITQETVDEFHAMPKNDQDERKDQGGYVGGVLQGGRRTAQTLANRSIVTLDLDHTGKQKTDDIIAQAEDAYKGMTWIAHCTHKHRDMEPRVRIILFLDRPVFADEYQAVSRQLAKKMGMDLFDDSTYEPHRLMYWPSIPSDLKYVFVDRTTDHGDGDNELVNVDSILEEYGPDGAWKDTTLWPTSKRQTVILKRKIERQADPHSKPGIIGAFCRIYQPIDKAIEEHLSDVYRHEGGNRYTYIEGSTSKGLVIYEGGKFAYSNHGTDPACGMLCNAFDLVRIHKFGHEDENSKPDTKPDKLPSYKSMLNFAGELEPVNTEMIKSMIDDAESIEEDGWLNKLVTTKEGAIKPIFGNVTEIFSHDPHVKRSLWYNENKHLKEYGKNGREWTNEDTLNIRKYLQDKYNMDVTGNVTADAVDWRADKQKHHPIKDYLNNIKGTWDGVKRVERLWIDYLDEEDNAFTKESAKVFILAAITRVFNPGVKFDYAPIISGPQGIGKSTFCEVLAVNPDWFGELTTFDEAKAVEQMRGKWIMELAELSVTNKSELEQQKHFMSGRSTTVRLAYRRDSATFHRQCVFIGSTNQKEYLKDTTGNRRWWPIDCGPGFSEAGKHIDVAKLKNERDQIWAEGMELYADIDSDLTLSPAAVKIAIQRQRGKLETDEWKGVIQSWLDLPASIHRYNKDWSTKAEEFNSLDGKGVEVRERVCVIEIWEDCLKMKHAMRKYDKNRIASILDNLDDWERKKTLKFGDRFGRQRAWVRKFEEAPF